MVEVGLTLIDVPLPTAVPPQLPEYQSTVSPLPTVADSVEDAPLQMVLGDADGDVGVLGRELIVTLTFAQLEAVQGDDSQRA